jgi:CRISPR-associated exonuclease Cas4
MLYLALLCLIAGLLLLWTSARQRRKSGLPGGRVIYTDTRAWGKVEKPLYAPRFHLTGKPDYLIERGEQLIPVEVKSRRVGQAPYDGHIYQLAAYCLLVQHVFGKRPPYGILHYANRTYAIDYTQELETALLALLEEMHEEGRRHSVNRSHDSPERCRRCGFLESCDQALA